MLHLNRHCGFGAGGGAAFENEAVALFARMTTPPSEARKAAINNLIASLKAAGVWSGMTAIYATAAADRQAAQLCWNNATYDLPSSGGTFTADRGFIGGLNTSAVVEAVNGYYLGVWVQGSAQQSANAIIGSGTGGSFTTIFPRYSDDNFYPYVNQAAVGAPLQANAVGSAGWYAGNRSAASAVQGYRNTTSSASSEPATSIPPSTIFLGRCNGFAGDSPDRYAAAMFGPASLTSGQNEAIRAAVAAYMSAVGA